MYQDRQVRFHTYLEEHMAQCREMERILAADDRKDEAVFEKIRGNVYEIFRTVFSMAQQTGGGEEEKVRHFFREKAEQIPQNWLTALEQAETHGQLEKAHLERLKLETAAEIRKAFAEIWEVKR